MLTFHIVWKLLVQEILAEKTMLKKHLHVFPACNGLQKRGLHDTLAEASDVLPNTTSKGHQSISHRRGVCTWLPESILVSPRKSNGICLPAGGPAESRGSRVP